MKKITISVVVACVVLIAGCRWIGIRGNGHIKIDERTIGEVPADMSGASELQDSGLQTTTAEIPPTGAADAEVAVAETLKVATTGAGKVSYSGNPTTVEKHISGAGSIRHRD